jgi:hypothetical protein
MAGYKILFEDEETSNQAIKHLEAMKDDPARAIADYTQILIGQLDDASGGMIPEEVILPAAGELIENVSELAKAADIFPVDEAVMQLAMQMLIPPLAAEYGAEPGDVAEIMNAMDPGIMRQMGESQAAVAKNQPPMRELQAAVANQPPLQAAVANQPPLQAAVANQPPMRELQNG